MSLLNTTNARMLLSFIDSGIYFRVRLDHVSDLSRSLLRVLAAAHVTELAAAFKEVVAHLVNLCRAQFEHPQRETQGPQNAFGPQLQRCQRRLSHLLNGLVNFTLVDAAALVAVAAAAGEVVFADLRGGT